MNVSLRKRAHRLRVSKGLLQKVFKEIKPHPFKLKLRHILNMEITSNAKTQIMLETKVSQISLDRIVGSYFIAEDLNQHVYLHILETFVCHV